MIGPVKPNLLYGTAWKGDQTETCVLKALEAGFRGIDTANQRKHYFEEAVGAAFRQAQERLGLKREQLFLQTKFTYARGQDHRKPYDENAPYPTQVRQSFESSLAHLHTDYLDSYLLHGPSADTSLTQADFDTWSEMETLYTEGKTRHLGIANVNLAQLEELIRHARVMPAFVQNRCYAARRWDQEIRKFCSAHGITYQGFSLLTANAEFLGGKFDRSSDESVPHLRFGDYTHPKVEEILRRTGRSISQVIFRFCHQIDILPLTGTRSPEHMKLDLQLEDFELSSEEVTIIENIAFS